MVQAFNKEKEIMPEEFLAVRQDLEFGEKRIRTKQAKVNGEVSTVAGQNRFQHAIIEELRD